MEANPSYEAKLNQNAKASLARLLAEENIGVRFNGTTPTACFDVKARELTLPAWKDMTEGMVDALLSHEVGHARWTALADFEQAMKRWPHYKDVFNVVEDARIERKIKGKFPGMVPSFKELWKEIRTRDLIGLRGKDVSSLPFIDRLNVFFKSCGTEAGETFNAREQKIVDAAAAAETWADVQAVVADIADLSKEADPNNQQGQGQGNEENNNGQEQGEGNGQGQGKGQENSNGNSNGSGEGQGEDKDSEGQGNGKGDGNNADSQGQGNKANTNDPKAQAKKAAAAQGRLDKAESTPGKGITCATGAAIDKALEQMIDKSAGGTWTYPTLNEAVAVVTVEEINKIWKASNHMPFTGRMAGEFNDFMVGAKAIAEHMAREFDQKRAAEQHSKTRVARTGKIDPVKIARYQVSDNIFRTYEITKDGKNHGVQLFFDMSGSITDVIGPITKQMIILALFCQKVGIPYEFYGFSDNARPNGNPWTNIKDNVNSKATLRQYIRNGLRPQMFKEQLYYMHALGRGDGVPNPEGFNGTPLNFAAAAMTPMAERFKKQYNLQKVITWVMTDGGATDHFTVTAGYNNAAALKYGKTTVRDTKNELLCNWMHRSTRQLSDVYSAVMGETGKLMFVYIADSLRGLKAELDKLTKKESIYFTNNGFKGAFFLIQAESLRINGYDKMDEDNFRNMCNGKKTQKLFASMVVAEMA